MTPHQSAIVQWWCSLIQVRPSNWHTGTNNYINVQWNQMEYGVCCRVPIVYKCYWWFSYFWYTIVNFVQEKPVWTRKMRHSNHTVVKKFKILSVSHRWHSYTTSLLIMSHIHHLTKFISTSMWNQIVYICLILRLFNLYKCLVMIKLSIWKKRIDKLRLLI